MLQLLHIRMARVIFHFADTDTAFRGRKVRLSRSTESGCMAARSCNPSAYHKFAQSFVISANPA